MKKIFLSTIVIVFISCKNPENIRQKPFIIVNKNSTYYSSKNKAEYGYQDDKGNTYEFTDNNNLYKIGDTIK